MTVRETLCSATRSKHVVDFTYDGHERRVEPYVVWKDSKDEWQLGGWSVGFSKSGTEPPWRDYALNKITAVSITDESFDGNRPGYNRNANRYEHACCKV